MAESATVQSSATMIRPRCCDNSSRQSRAIRVRAVGSAKGWAIGAM